MKKFLSLCLLLTSIYCPAQVSTVVMKADTVKMYKEGGNTELILRNQSRSLPGFLKNKGNGLTEFAYTVDSVFRKPGTDSVFFYKGPVKTFAYRDSLGTGSGGISDGDKGDLTVSSSGSVWTIDNNAVTNAKINSVAWSKITTPPTTISGYAITDAQPLDADLTAIAGLTPTNDDIIQRKSGAWINRSIAQLKTDIGPFSTSVNGLVPSPGVGSGRFLKEDGTWQVPAGGGGSIDTSNKWVNAIYENAYQDSIIYQVGTTRTAVPVFGPKYIHVFLFIGQSNVVGHGTSSGSQTIDPGTGYQFSYADPSGLKPANDPIGFGYSQAATGSIGPAFVRQYYSMVHIPVLIVAAGKDGSAQCAAATTGGNGNWDVSGNLFDSACARLDSAMIKGRRAGFYPVFSGIISDRARQTQTASITAVPA